jgi:hypothetical protein
MSTSVRRPAVLGATRGVSLAVSAGALSVTAHQLADGGLPDPAMTVLLSALFGWTATALARKARGPVATITLLGAAQLVMHLLLTTLAGHHDMYTMPGEGLGMVTAHAVATVLTALLLSHADETLLSLLAALRAILPRLLGPLPVPVAPATLVPARTAAPSHLVGVDLRRIHGRRGPPGHS